MNDETFTRRKLPHWYVPGAVHFVTYRLAGTIPQAVLRTWRAQRKAAVGEARRTGRGGKPAIARAQKQFFGKYDAYLDAHPGQAYLRDPRVAALIRENLYHHRGRRYRLLAYCIMPNHVHVLLQPLPVVVTPDEEMGLSDEVSDHESPLSKAMHSLKSYTANAANDVLGRTGKFWQAESYDHWVRNDDELERILDYIAHNPVSAGLVSAAHLWQHSSAHDRFIQDGTTDSALLDVPDP